MSVAISTSAVDRRIGGLVQPGKAVVQLTRLQITLHTGVLPVLIVSSLVSNICYIPSLPDFFSRCVCLMTWQSICACLTSVAYFDFVSM